MNALPSVLAVGKFSSAVLSVYADNKRAVAAYRRAGWIAIGEPTPHARTGRLGQGYRNRARSTVTMATASGSADAGGCCNSRSEISSIGLAKARRLRGTG